MAEFPFRIHATDDLARTGSIMTPRGAIATPAFMPVGTAGTVKAMFLDDVRAAGTGLILGNTYHLMLRPGAERIRRLGGLHRFMGWTHPLLTDSGGFQVFSLSALRKMKEEGVEFRSHIDGSMHFLSPERSIEIQADLLGSDIAMQLDECVANPCDHQQAAAAMRLSARWGDRCKAFFGVRDRQSLFGIVQGATYPDLRRESAQRVLETGFDGYAIGGLAVGEGHDAMCEVISLTAPLLPEMRPRYLMGVGKPLDILEAIARGIDMFDCVLPTRSGRHGQAWTWDGAVNIKNARFAEDESPLDEQSSCPASRDYSKAYLHHLFRAGEYLGPMLLSWHNIAFFQAMMMRIRSSITEGRFSHLRAELNGKWRASDFGQDDQSA